MNGITEPLAPLTDARVRELSNLARCGPDVVVAKKKRKYYPKSLSRGKAWATSEAGLQRFLDLVSPEPNTGCWLWAGCVGTGGYGHCTIDGYHARAHIASYLIFRGGIPDGLVLDHLCRVRSCVNPDHLEAGDILVGSVHKDEDPSDPNRELGNDAAGIVALRNHAEKLLAVCEAAERVAKLGWGTSVSESEHFVRIATMDNLRAKLRDLD